MRPVTFIRKGLIFSFDFQSLNLKIVADFDNPVSCLEYLRSQHVDIIITDIKMPLMSGLEMIGKIEDKKKEMLLNLSGGEQQKVAIGSSLAVESKMLLLDEPTANLDTLGRQEINELINNN